MHFFENFTVRQHRSGILSALTLLLTLCINQGSVASENPAVPEQSYISCSIITSEHLTTLQLYQRGLSLESALETLPNISRGAKKRVRYIYDLADSIGILNAYSDINTNYARCATKVYIQLGTPAQDKIDYGYYFCAGENKIRYEIILYINKYLTLEKVLESTPDTHSDVAMRYYRLISDKGLLSAFDFTANNLKSCLNNLR